MLTPIESPPATWEELELRVTQILNEAGLHTERGKSLQTTRGSVAVDVYAEDHAVMPPVVTLIECKHWKRPIPQTVAHAFRTVVADSGANTGLIVSLHGFQSGAEGAIRHSNIRLVDWQVFQALFADRWYRNYMMKRGWKALSPLIEYVEPINNSIFRKADALPKDTREEFKSLRQKHFVPAMTLVPIFFQSPFPSLGISLPPLPLRLAHADLDDTTLEKFPDVLVDATTLREFLEAAIVYFEATVAEFDALFDERV